MIALSDGVLYARLREILESGWIPVPKTPGFGGSGAPGKLLENLLGINGGNFDSPDAGRWEIKFHSGTALITLFHLEAKPSGHMHDLIREFGWKDAQGRTSFRHTIRGKSDKGFQIFNINDQITVRNSNNAITEWPYWTHDKLISAFVGKLRRLIVVKGQRKKDQVLYKTAHLYQDPRATTFTTAIENGTIAIDFDARTTDGKGLRNHGTKFRISFDDLCKLYHKQKNF